MSNGVLDVLDGEELLALARVDMDADRIDAALVKLKIAQSKDVSAEVDALLGRLYAKLALFEKAKSCFVRYLEVYPDALISRFQYGMVHMDEGDVSSAVKEFDKVLEQDDKHPPSLYHKAVALNEFGEAPLAIKVLDALLSSASEDNYFHQRGVELRAQIESGVNISVDQVASRSTESPTIN